MYCCGEVRVWVGGRWLVGALLGGGCRVEGTCCGTVGTVGCTVHHSREVLVRESVVAGVRSHPCWDFSDMLHSLDSHDMVLLLLPLLPATPATANSTALGVQSVLWYLASCTARCYYSTLPPKVLSLPVLLGAGR